MLFWFFYTEREWSSIRKAFIVQGAKLLKRFRLLTTDSETTALRSVTEASEIDFCSSQSFTMDQQRRRRDPQELSTATVKQLENEIWSNIFHLECETKRYDEAAKLAGDSDIFDLKVNRMDSISKRKVVVAPIH